MCLNLIFWFVTSGDSYNDAQRFRLAALRVIEIRLPAWSRLRRDQITKDDKNLPAGRQVTNADKPYSSAVLRQAIVGRCFSLALL